MITSILEIVLQTADTYKKYGAGFTDINNWRRANVDKLIQDLSKAIKAASKDVSFGISPFGIWANKTTNPLGSDTKGNQSFSSIMLILGNG